MLKFIGKHVGNQVEHVPGYPARDLTDEEVKLYGEKELLATGLYEKVKKEAKSDDKG